MVRDEYRSAQIVLPNGSPLWVKTRRTGAPPERSASEGEADEINTKTAVALKVKQTKSTRKRPLPLECRLLGVEQTLWLTPWNVRVSPRREVGGRAKFRRT
jgi:hypothetical protein